MACQCLMLMVSVRTANPAYATDKKFMSAVQDILIPPADSQPLQAGTRERIRDTLAHLNYVYGGLKGGEHLRACWVKVKTQEEPEEVRGLFPSENMSAGC